MATRIHKLNVGQVANLRRVGNPPGNGSPALAPVANRRAGFHPALQGKAERGASTLVMLVILVPV
jgi:hypothetical protein